MGDEMRVWEDKNGHEFESMREQWAWKRVYGRPRWKTKQVYESAVMVVNSERSGVVMGSECMGGPKRA